MNESLHLDAALPGSTVDKNVPSRKRFQNPLLEQPSLTLDAEGTITQITPSALRLLEHRKKDALAPCFFSHVHGKNLYQVMRDVADMVCFGKANASWLLRLRTGQGRWRWYKVTAKNKLGETESRIQLSLRDVHEW